MKRGWAILVFVFLMIILKSIFAIPTVSFVSPTPTENVSGDYIYVNVSSSGDEHYSFVDFDDDLVLWMRMDDRNSTHVFDNSSNGLHGSIENGTTFSSGRYGNASEGDGVDNYIHIEDSSAFDFTENDEMTVCVWIYPKGTANSYGASQGVIGQWWSGGIHGYSKKSFAIAEGITAVNGGYSFYVSPDGSSWQDAKSNGALTLNEWHHLCGTVGGGYSRFYVDGVQQTDTGSINSMHNPDGPLAIGTYFYSSSGSLDSTLFYNGSVDEVLIFNRELSLEEIRAIYNSSQYASFANNYTSLANGSHSFTGYGVEVDAEVSSVSRTIFTGVADNSSNGTNESNSSIPEITLTSNNYIENDYNITISTDVNVDSCWFVENGINTTMTSISSTSFYDDSLGAGLYDVVFYCNNSNGTGNLSESFEFRKVVSFYDSHYTNSQGLEIYFDFNYNYTSEGGKLIITSDTWSSDKDSSTLHDAEAEYMPLGYAIASVETRGKGSSGGSPDAYGYCCLDIYELAQYILGNVSYNDYVDNNEGVYLTGASGAGGRTGVCTAKYPDFFTSAHSTVGVLNLTLWWETAGSGDVNEIENRVGCDPTQCPEAYEARDAGYLGYNTLTPMSVEHPVDDSRVTVNCSRDYNESLVIFGKTVNYTEPSSGGHRADWDPSFDWFDTYEAIPILPNSGDLRIGGFVHTKNFSIFLDEFSVDHMAYVDYNLSDYTFNLTTKSFDGDVNFTLFDLTPNTNYSVDGTDNCVESDVNGDLFFVVDVDNYSSILIDVDVAVNCSVGNQTNETNETYPDLTIDFVSPTPTEDVSEDYIYVNTSSNGTEHYSFVDFDNDLIGFWRLENNSFVDESSYGNDGVAVNGSDVVSGKYGNSFDGDGNGKYVAIPDSSSIDSISTNNEMSVCTWVYPYSNDNDWGSYQGVIGQWQTTGNKKSFAIAEGIPGQGIYAFYVSPDGSSWQDAQSNSALSLNEWHHLCGVVESGTVKLYINGVQQTDTGTVAGIANSDVNLTIGYYYTSAIYFNGSIDESLLFNRSLSLEEIRAIYNSSAYASFANNYTSLVDGNHSFKAFAINGTEVVSVERTIETGYSSPPANNAPSMDLVIINSSNGNNYTTEDLICYAQASDSDGDNVSYEGYWYKNGNQDLGISSSVFSEGNLVQVSVLGSGNTSVNDTWSCEIRAYDGENYSSYLSSDNLTVLEEPQGDNPAVIYMNSPTFVVTFDGNVTDDNGITNVSLMGNWSGWQEDQTNSSGANDAIYTFSRYFSTAGTYLWAFRVYDSAGQITNSENKTFTLEFM